MVRIERLAATSHRSLGLENYPLSAYICRMTERQRVDFSGTVLRIERDGFGIIKFDHPVGPSNNTHGLISNSSGTVVLSPAGGMLQTETLAPGVHVTGTAETSERDVASVKTVIIEARGFASGTSTASFVGGAANRDPENK